MKDLAGEVNINLLQYRVVEGRLVVADNAGFTLEINEFGPTA